MAATQEQTTAELLRLGQQVRHLATALDQSLQQGANRQGQLTTMQKTIDNMSNADSGVRDQGWRMIDAKTIAPEVFSGSAG